MFKKNKITFIDSTQGNIQPEFYPTPAKRDLPDWYKSINSFYEETNVDNLKYLGARGAPTVKKCMPVFDALSSGYLIKLVNDVVVFDKPGDTNPWYRWSNDETAIMFHDYDQIEGYPLPSPHLEDVPVAKFKNNWGVKTPSGYSCWIKQPSHRALPFEILEGVVDTDTFNIPIEFPFFLKDPDWRGLIPAGTPIAQIIPFKRESFVHDHKIESENFAPSQTQLSRIRAVFDNGYKSFFWQRKSYD